MSRDTSIKPNEHFRPDQHKKLRPNPDEPYQPTEPDDPEGPDETESVKPLSFDDDSVADMQLDDFDEGDFDVDSDQAGAWGSAAQLEGDAGLGDTGLNYTGMGDSGLSDGIGGRAGDADFGDSGIGGSGLGSDSALGNDLDDDEDAELEDELENGDLEDDGMGGESIIEKDLSPRQRDAGKSRHQSSNHNENAD